MFIITKNMLIYHILMKVFKISLILYKVIKIWKLFKLQNMSQDLNQLFDFK